MSTIAIVGTGYVGLAYAVAMADLGNDVVGVDVDAARVAELNAGRCPIYEPGLDELLTRNLAAERVVFTTDYRNAIVSAEFAFLCVGTPSLPDGSADMRQVRAAAVEVGRSIAANQQLIIVNKSTMPIGSADLVSQLVAEHADRTASFHVVTNPEFLREGSAIWDIFHPDRIVLGASDDAAAQAVASLYAPLNAPILHTDRKSAEMVKYAANAFLATKISFINEVATICEALGADVTTVARGVGLDARIGSQFLEAGVGFGGSCFPKDVAAIAGMAESTGLHPQLLRAVLDINDDMRKIYVDKLEQLLGVLNNTVVAVLGLSFKEDTDDIRDSPAVAIAKLLGERGATVRAYDPAAMDRAGGVLREVKMCGSAYEAATGADAVLVVTPWREFRQIDPERLCAVMRGNLVLDGRNLYEPSVLEAAGLRYAGIGRRSSPSSLPMGVAAEGAATKLQQ